MTDQQGSFGGARGDGRFAPSPDDRAPDDDAGPKQALSCYLALAALADQQLPQLGFFPPALGYVSGQESAVGYVSGQEGAAGTGASVRTIPAEIRSRIMADPVAWFTAERRNLLEIIGWACAHGEYRAAAQLAARQLTFQFLRHRVDDADQMWRAVERAAEAAGDIATSSEARFHLAWVMADGGRVADAHAALDKCIPILEARGVRGTLAAALYWRGVCSNTLGLPEAQRDDGERCLGLARQLREPGLEVMALRVLGFALVRLGSYDRGLALCEQAVALAREKEQLAWEYYAITSLAHALWVAGRHDRGEYWCQQGIEVSGRLGLFVTGQAYMLGMLGDSYTGQGRYREAVEAFCQAKAEFEAAGDRRGQALCLLKLGRAHILLGERQQAAELLQQCFPMFGELGLPAYEDAVITALDECRPSAEGTIFAAASS